MNQEEYVNIFDVKIVHFSVMLYSNHQEVFSYVDKIIMILGEKYRKVISPILDSKC